MSNEKLKQILSDYLTEDKVVEVIERLNVELKQGVTASTVNPTPNPPPPPKQ